MGLLEPAEKYYLEEAVFTLTAAEEDSLALSASLPRGSDRRSVSRATVDLDLSASELLQAQQQRRRIVEIPVVNSCSVSCGPG